MPYFERLGPSSFRPTEHVGGAWDTSEQHIAPALGLLAHVVDVDRDSRRSDGLRLTRLSYDIWGTVPIEPVETSVRLLRPGRTIELAEAALTHGGRRVATLRAWSMQPRDTSALEGTALPPIPSPDDTPAWEPDDVWPGGFIAAAHVRRRHCGPGRASFWVRSDEALVDGEPVSPTAHAARLLDIANGMAVRVDPREVAFPNVDLTAHLYREPHGEWLGFDTTVSFGADGLGVTSTVLHDAGGPLGTMAQMLTVRPLPPSA
ncbi:MAG TPA: thioesterase family protein [Actinomycetales bacterium]|nr:thioesterase family protein [Actinomycetales bacterium]